MENWKDVKGYDGRYQVSSLGRVKSRDMILPLKNDRKRIRKGCIRKQHVGRKGYYYVSLYDANGRGKTWKVHQLVANAFIPNPEGLTDIHHINDDKSDNRVVNLRRLSNSEHTVISKAKPTLAKHVNSGTEFIFRSAAEAARQLNLGHSAVSMAALRRSQTGEYRFEYL